MKKVLSVLGLIVILGMTSPAFAGPHGPGGPGGHGGHGMHGGPHGGHRIHAGAHHRPHMAPRHHHGGMVIHAGYPRHNYRYGYRHGYWRGPWCDYRLGWGDPYCGYYYPMSGASFSIRF